MCGWTQAPPAKCQQEVLQQMNSRPTRPRLPCWTPTVENEMGEFGGSGSGKAPVGKVNIEHKINATFQEEAIRGVIWPPNSSCRSFRS